MKLNIISIFMCNRMKYFWLYRSRKFRDERFGIAVPRAAKLFLDSMGFSQFRGMTKIDVLHLVGTGKRALAPLGSVPRCRRIFPKVLIAVRDFRRESRHSPTSPVQRSIEFISCSKLPVDRISPKFREEKWPT